MELAQQFRVNRMTVAKVLRALKAEGILQRRRGDGTRLLRIPELEGGPHDPLVELIFPAYQEPNLTSDSYLNQFLCIFHAQAFQRRWRLQTRPIPSPLSDDFQLKSPLCSEDTVGVVIGTPHEDAQQFLLPYLEKLPVPVVGIGWGNLDDGLHHVDICQRTGGWMLANFLLEREFRHLVFVTSAFDTPAKRRRWGGVQAALRRYPGKAVCRLVEAPYVPTFRRAGEECGMLLLELLGQVPVDALIVCDYGLLEGMDQVFQRKFGKHHRYFQLPVVTFDLPPHLLSNRFCCTIRQPVSELIGEVFAILDAQSSGVSPGSSPVCKTLYPELITL